MKKLIILIGFILISLTTLTVKAADYGIQDDANLLSETTKSQLLEKMAEESEKLKTGIFIYTTNEYTSDNQTTSDLYLADKVGFNNNGIVLVINMNIRNMHISTSGIMMKFWTDSRLNRTLDEIQDQLKSNDYDDAASLFVERIITYRKKGISGKSYTITSDGKLIIKNAISFTEASIAGLIAIICSILFFIITRLKYQLKIGNYKFDYQANSNVEITEKHDDLIRSYVTTRIIPRSTGGGGSSGGGSHSTGGGSFGGGGRSF